MKKYLLRLSLVIVVLVIILYFWLVPKYTVPILIYHAIGYEQNSHFVSPENFVKQMEYIKKKGYKVITLGELVRAIQSKKRFKKDEVVITFDDGYQDNFKYAYPVLINYGFPATVFLITDSVGGEKRFLNWDEIRVMAKNNISFGAHTKTHFYLGTAKDDKITREQIFGSKEIIERKIGMPVEYFCYPTGGFNENVKKIVKDAGFRGACTTNRGFDSLNSDVYELKRVKITNSDTIKPFSFWMKLSGYYNLIRSKKNPY